MYRRDPVRRTGRRRHGSYFRHPRTTSECRAYYAYPAFIRGKRRPNCLPNAWDDIPHYRKYKNWKHYRQTQYKQV